MTKEEREFLEYLQVLEKKLMSMYGNLYKDALKIQEVRKAIEKGDKNFTFDKNKSAAKNLQKLLNNLSNQTMALINTGINSAFNQGQNTVKVQLVDALGGSKVKDESINEIIQEATNKHRNSAMNAGKFSNQQRGGLKLSDRVWNLQGNAIKEIETILQNGIIEGKGAKEISQSIAKYLNNPDALFRRVRNKETGKLELSKAAKNYNPGQGVYRSAHQNALRVLRNEINRGYRRSEWESYQNNHLIAGYSIVLSNAHPVYDICDELQGDYPKWFVWEGWHVNCFCKMIPIFISKKDFSRYLDLKDEGRENEFVPSNLVKNPPAKFHDWLRKNKERIAKAKSLPYWMEDNADYIENIF